MDLRGALASPTLDRRQHEVGLLLQDARVALLCGLEGSLGHAADRAARTLLAHDGECLDDAEHAIVVARAASGRLGRF